MQELRNTGIDEEHYQFMNAMRWAAARVGPGTLSFEIKASPSMLTMVLLELSGLKRALLVGACHLKCFSFDTMPVLMTAPGSRRCQRAAAWKAFQQKFLERARHIVALRLMDNAPCLFVCSASLQHLKHLEMQAHAFVDRVAHNARQLLPNLETLCLHEEFNVAHGGIDLRGCHRLRHLAVKGGDPQPVLHEPGCQLSIHLQHRGGLALRLLPVQQVPEAATNLHLSREHSVCEHPANIEVLKLSWPGYWGVCTFPNLNEAPNQRVGVAVGYIGSHAARTLRRYMPVRGQPWMNLTCLVIWADRSVSPEVMTCCIPRGLPNLEEVVLLARGGATVSFEDPLTTFSALKSLHIFGQPLITDMDGDTMRQVSDSLARRGLLLSAVSADSFVWGKIEFNISSVCMYLRPITEQERPLLQLYERVRELGMQCRCKACFQCLKGAGCPTR